MPLQCSVIHAGVLETTPKISVLGRSIATHENLAVLQSLKLKPLDYLSRTTVTKEKGFMTLSPDRQRHR